MTYKGDDGRDEMKRADAPGLYHAVFYKDYVVDERRKLRAAEQKIIVIYYPGGDDLDDVVKEVRGKLGPEWDHYDTYKPFHATAP